MYYCLLCKQRKNVLHEAVYHTNHCTNKFNRMVYSDFRVAPHQQYRRHRHVKKYTKPAVTHKDTPLNTQIKNLLIISKMTYF